VLPVAFRRRWQHLRESIEALRELWTKDEASYDGEIVRFPPVKLYPKPVQKPGPPIILGAHDPKHALRRVARYADGWCPRGLTPDKARECIPQIRTMARDFGRDPDKLDFSVLQIASSTAGPATATSCTIPRRRRHSHRNIAGRVGGFRRPQAGT
jgi:alkanesulfonate monooxygenase SsuD/methylene tetrahydromethanopterin reductase-like flavin-dependent oxidoreductase (luciferase family)